MLDGGLVAVQGEMPKMGWEVDGAGDALHELLVLAPVGDEVSDGDDQEAVLLCEGLQAVQPHHRAVFVQDLASDGDRLEPGKFAKIDGSFRVTRASENASAL